MFSIIVIIIVIIIIMITLVIDAGRTRACPGGKRHAECKRELEYGIPRLHYPVDSRRFPDIFADVRKNKLGVL